ncbi:hypothetical protein Tco_1510788, partial [Tanacetum coccineum]
MGIVVKNSKVDLTAADIGCMTLKSPFSYLCVKVGGRMMCTNSWEEINNKLLSRLSKWKMKTLLIGGRLTLLKSVLGSMSIYYMSMFEVPKQVLKKMESIRSHFFKGADLKDRKISLVIYALESIKSITVTAKTSQPGLDSSLRRMPRGGIKQHQMADLCLKMEDIILPNMMDRWFWSLSGSGEFSVAV